jgi:hypothetical protein
LESIHVMMKPLGTKAGWGFALGWAWLLLVGAIGAAEPTAGRPERSGDLPIRSLPLPGIENAFSVGNRFFSGSTPEGEAAFAALAKLGVKTLLSVDGSAPNVEAARRHGLRYVHLPIGYDGIAPTNAVRLVKAAESLPGPVYVHCHHGRHRGPTAVAVMAEGLEGWTPEQATEWLKAAGTDPHYTGLYRAVATFRMPSKETLAAVPAAFPERATTPGLVDLMVRVDGHFDALKGIRQAGFQTPPREPDLVPATEALQLLELMKEAKRTGVGATRNERFQTELGLAVQAAEALHGAVVGLATDRSKEQLAKAEAAFVAVQKNCASCHRASRD